MKSYEMVQEMKSYEMKEGESYSIFSTECTFEKVTLKGGFAFIYAATSLNSIRYVTAKTMAWLLQLR